MYKKAFAPIIFEDSKILILGTMPGEKALEKQQYFAHRTNQFWRLIASVFEESLPEAYEDKILLLKKYKIALWEVLESCSRTGSADQKISNPKPNELIGFINTHSSLQYVVFESKAACKYYSSFFDFLSNIRYETLPSPSAANARLNFQEKLSCWQILKQFYQA